VCDVLLKRLAGGEGKKDQRSCEITKICIVSDTVDDTHNVIVPHIPAPTFDRASRSRATLL
jgi:hypothetical protein